jgi:hypothetical protein
LKVTYRHGSKVGEGAGDSLLFDATVLHGIEAIHVQSVSDRRWYSTLRE